MSENARVLRRAKHPACLAAVALVALAGCSEVESSATATYQPASVDPRSHRVTLTAEGAERTGVRTAVVRRIGARVAVPYAALVYDGQGAPHVYSIPDRLTFERVEVKVARIARGRALLDEGPPAGTRVVTTGAAEIYGAELGIDGGH